MDISYTHNCFRLIFSRQWTSRIAWFALIVTVLSIRYYIFPSPGIADVNIPQTVRHNYSTRSHENAKRGKESGIHENVYALTQVTQERRHIGFLKVHKAGSSTVQNILYRFGLARNLSFVLPSNGHYLSKTKYHYNPIMPPLPGSGSKYDILCSHCRFNIRKFQDFLHEDTVYVAIVREPLDLFISAAYYYKYVWKFPYLDNLNDTTFISDLLFEPKIYEPKTIGHSQTFNPMAYDFGFEMTSVDQVLNTSENSMNDFVYHIGCTFNFVMVMERFDESLVMLKRLLGWTLRDIVYLKQNTYQATHNLPREKNLTNEEVSIFQKRNKFDYIIYNYFRERFEKQLAEEKDLDAEVKQFHSILVDTQTFCELQDDDHGTLTIQESIWNARFIISMNDCRLMKMEELSMFDLMKNAHKKLLQKATR